MDKDILGKLVSAGITAKKTDDALRAVGYTDTPYFTIYGHITDALYALFGEHTDTFDESLTYRIMTCPDMTDDQRTELLAAVCQTI